MLCVFLKYTYSMELTNMIHIEKINLDIVNIQPNLHYHI